MPGLPAYSAVEISKNNKLHIEMKTVSDRARNPSNQADPYELKAIEYFKNNSNEHESFKRE